MNYAYNDYYLNNNNKNNSIIPKLNLNASIDKDKFPTKLINNQIKNNTVIEIKTMNENKINFNEKNYNYNSKISQNENYYIDNLFSNINEEKRKSEKPLNISNCTVSISEVLFNKPPPTHYTKSKILSKSCSKLELENMKNKLSQNFQKDFSGKSPFKYSNNNDTHLYNSNHKNDFIDNERYDSYSNRDYELRTLNQKLNMEIKDNTNEINKDYLENVGDDNDELIKFITSDGSKKRRISGKIQNTLKDEMKFDINEINNFLNEGEHENLNNLNNENFNTKNGSGNYNKINIAEEINKEMKFIKKISAEIKRNHLETLSTNDINDNDNPKVLSEEDLEREINKIKSQVKFNF